MNLNLSALYDPIEALTESNLRTDAAKQALKNYDLSCQRACTIIDAIIYTGVTTKILQSAKATSVLKVTGELRPEDLFLDWGENDREAGVAVRSFFNPLNPQRSSEIQRSILSDLDSCIAALHDARVGLMFGTLLKGIIMESWTALEIMFGDLWRLAVNQHPKQLAVLTPPDYNKGSYRTALEMLDKNNFSVSHKMGDILFELHELQFHKSEKRKDIYKESFSQDGDRVVAALANPHIDSLGHIRNMIAHTGGSVDRNFLLRTKEEPVRSVVASIRDLGYKGELLVDGPFVRHFAYKALELGYELIREADIWLDTH